MAGLFVTLEGADGTGKTTACRNVARQLREAGKEVAVTREPGGGRIAEQIRSLLLDPENRAMAPWTEALLHAAARSQHLQDVILPALEAGKIVLCDRYVDSSLVYQGMARGLGEEQVMAVNEIATQGKLPDLTFVLQAPEDVCRNRRQERAVSDRMEQEDRAFHQKVREGFACLPVSGRHVPVDASRSPEEVAAFIADRILSHAG